MNEDLFASSWLHVCDQLLVLRKSDVWRTTRHTSFYDYAEDRWNLSKTRVKLYCDFSMFCAMCRAENVKTPDSPDIVKPILEQPKKRWLEIWAMCLDKQRDHSDLVPGPITYKDIVSTMNFFGFGIRRRVPPEVLKARKVRAAAKTIAELGDGEALVEEIGSAALGRDFDKAVSVIIDADQARMNKR